MKTDADSLRCQLSLSSSKPRNYRHNGTDSQSNGCLIHHLSKRHSECFKAIKIIKNKHHWWQYSDNDVNPLVKDSMFVTIFSACSNLLVSIIQIKQLKPCVCEDRWVMLSKQQLYIGLPAAPLPSFHMAESWRCHWTLKMIPLMLYSCMFSATADPLYCDPGRTVKSSQMGMSRCHFNYVSFLSL